MEEGEHTFSIYAADTGMQIDRIYLSRGDELPPVDNEWESSERVGEENKAGKSKEKFEKPKNVNLVGSIFLCYYNKEYFLNKLNIT